MHVLEWSEQHRAINCTKHTVVVYELETGGSSEWMCDGAARVNGLKVAGPQRASLACMVNC